MKKIHLLAIFGILLIVSSYKIISTSYQSNLFDLMAAWGDSNFDTYPWFSATLWDFYGNFILIAVWVAYKEKNWTPRILWIVFLAAMGSPGTALYVLLKLRQLQSHEGLKELISN